MISFATRVILTLETCKKSQVMSLWGQGEKISIKIPDTSEQNDILILRYRKNP